MAKVLAFGVMGGTSQRRLVREPHSEGFGMVLGRFGHWIRVPYLCGCTSCACVCERLRVCLGACLCHVIAIVLLFLLPALSLLLLRESGCRSVY